MRSRVRARLAWWLMAGTAAYALASVAIYAATGRFTLLWLLVSVVVYAALLLAALVLAMTDEGAPAAPAPPPSEGRLVERDVLYTTRRGYLLRLTYAQPDGRRDTRLLLCDAEGSTPLPDAQAAVDALPDAPVPAHLARDADAALAARAAPYPKVIP